VKLPVISISPLSMTFLTTGQEYTRSSITTAIALSRLFFVASAKRLIAAGINLI